MTPKTKKEMMRRLRDERRKQGLVPFADWVTPEMRDKIKKMIEKG